MIAKILTVHNDQVVIDEVIFSIPEFKALWDTYEDVKPFQYLYYLYDPESAYMNFSDYEREEEVSKDYFVEPSILNSIEFIEAKEKCEKLYDSAIRKILKGAKIAVEKLAKYFAEEEISSGRDGNLTAIKSALVDLPKILKGYQEAENAFLQEVQKNRAGIKSASDEGVTGDWD